MRTALLELILKSIKITNTKAFTLNSRFYHFSLSCRHIKLQRHESTNSHENAHKCHYIDALCKSSLPCLYHTTYCANRMVQSLLWDSGSSEWIPTKQQAIKRITTICYMQHISASIYRDFSTLAGTKHSIDGNLCINLVNQTKTRNNV